MIFEEKPPPPYSSTSSSSSVFRGGRRSRNREAQLHRLPAHILLQVVYWTCPEGLELEDRRTALYWLVSSLRHVSRDLWTASMHLLRSSYLPLYARQVQAPYTTDPFPASAPILSTASSELTRTQSLSSHPSIITLQRETSVLDLFIVLRARADARIDESDLYLDYEEDRYRDLFTVMQPRSRMEDLVRDFGVRANLISLSYPSQPSTPPLYSFSAHEKVPFSRVSVLWATRKVALRVGRSLVAEVDRIPGKDSLETLSRRLVNIWQSCCGESSLMKLDRLIRRLYAFEPVLVVSSTYDVYCVNGDLSRCVPLCHLCGAMTRSGPATLDCVHCYALTIITRTMSSSKLDPQIVLKNVPNILPEGLKTLKTPQEAIAALLHSALSSAGFFLTGIDDASSSTKEEDLQKREETNVLPNDWNWSGPDSFTFCYRRDEETDLVYTFKLVKLAKRLIIHALAGDEENTTTMEVNVPQFTPDPFTPTPELSSTSSSNQEVLSNTFLSDARVADLVEEFEEKLIKKLAPSASKNAPLDDDPLRVHPERQELPDALRKADPRPSQRPDAEGGPSQPRDPGKPFIAPPNNASPRSPLEIGSSDLNPFQGGTIGGFAPPSLFPGSGGAGIPAAPRGGDGMFVGPSHPLFNDRFSSSNSPGRGGVGGPWAGDGFLPPMGAPPGARFDPVGPFGPGAGPNRGLPSRGRGGFFGGPGRGGGAGGPDNDEFMPPGSGSSDYDSMFS